MHVPTHEVLFFTVETQEEIVHLPYSFLEDWINGCADIAVIPNWQSLLKSITAEWMQDHFQQAVENGIVILQ